MKNFVFLSPNFPTNYWKFCKELKENGMRVLGIGDEPYEQLDENVKNSLHEYYKVGSLENYDEVYRAVAFLPSNTGGLTGWKAITNTGWSRMLSCGRISILPQAFRCRICRG